MRRRAPGDALRLDPDVVAWHQSQSFVAEPGGFAERLEASPLFRGAFRRHRGRAEWIRFDDESDALAFPLGLVTVHDDGILLDAFSEERMAALCSRVRELGAGAFTPDETRVFPLGHALANPGALARPLEEKRGEVPDAHAVVEVWLRMAWPFLPRPDLGGRLPVSVMTAGRGREAVEQILPALAAELSARPGFPRFSEEVLRAILLGPAPGKPSRPAPARTPAGGAPRS